MDRYSRLRRILVEVKSEAVGLSEEHIATVQSVILQFNDIQKRADETFSSGKPAPDIARINKIVSGQIVKIHEIAVALKAS